jgi:signal transduction histidine kinase
MNLPPESGAHALRGDYDRSCLRIEKLMNDAQTLAQIDVASEGFIVTSLRLARILQDALDAIARQLPDVEVRASVADVEGVAILGEPKLLTRAFSDLLSTATQCVGAGGSITLEALAAAGRVSVVLTTTGNSLSQEALETFFDVGGQRALLREGGDFGLGAALASRVMRLFNGHVSVRNGSERGLVIEISLPTV